MQKDQKKLVHLVFQVYLLICPLYGSALIIYEVGNYYLHNRYVIWASLIL